LTLAVTARESLRELCADHFHGLISTEAYRLRRTALLDEVISGNDSHVSSERTQPRPDATSPTIRTNTRATTVDAPRRWLMFLSAGGVAVLALVAAVMWLMPRAEFPPSDATALQARGTPQTRAPIPVRESVAVAPEAAGAFVVRFLDSNNWSEAALSEFLFDWDQLTDAERTTVHQSAQFRSLVQRLQSRILERRARADGSIPENVDGFRLFVSFARELDVDPGISDVELSSRTIPR
jgi:hypothetical protein